MASGEWPGSPAPKDNFQNGNRSIDGASSSSQGFWDRIESSIESDYDSITSSVESGFNSLSRGVTDLFPAGGLANLQISQYFYQKYESISLQAPQAFLQQVVDEIKNSTWTGLETVSNCVFGPTSIQVGIVYGLGESLVKDVWSLLGLAKLLCLANLYAHLDSHSLIAASDPVTWALANALDQIPAVHSEMKMAHDRVQEMWKELGEIVRHPGPFFSVVGKDISKEFKDDWKSFTIFCERPTLVHGFLLGKAVGRILYQLIMLLLVVEGAAKTAASIASKFPRLARIARVVEAGGRLADLEIPERMAAGGASAGEEIGEGTKAAVKSPSDAQEASKAAGSEEDAAAQAARRNELAKDPAHNGKINKKSLREADVGLDLENQGKLKPPIVRDPSGNAEFVDGDGIKWDIKRFNSNFPPEIGGFDATEDLGKIQRELRNGENVIVDTADMSPQDISRLKEAVDANGISDKVIFYP